MKAAINAPFSDYRLNIGSYAYGLAHLALESPEYRSYLKENTKFTILDNGADELGTGMSGQKLWDLFLETRPNELILPDVLKSSTETLKASTEFYREFIEESDVKPESLMAVAQGTTFEEFVGCFKAWCETEYVDVIGVPYDVDFPLPFLDDPEGYSKTSLRSFRRGALVTYLLDFLPDGKTIHLLGMNNLWEFFTYLDLPAVQRCQIRSTDSTGPLAAAISGKAWENSRDDLYRFDKDWVPLDFYHEWDNEEWNVATGNLMLYALATGDYGMIFNLGVLEGEEQTRERFHRD